MKAIINTFRVRCRLNPIYQFKQIFYVANEVPVHTIYAACTAIPFHYEYGA